MIQSGGDWDGNDLDDDEKAPGHGEALKFSDTEAPLVNRPSLWLWLGLCLRRCIIIIHLGGAETGEEVAVVLFHHTNAPIKHVHPWAFSF